MNHLVSAALFVSIGALLVLPLVMMMISAISQAMPVLPQ